jgi:hypothetical protein
LSFSLKSLLRLPYLPIILAPIVLFSPSLFTGRVLFWGLPALQFIPWRDFAWQSLQNGVLPLWNPFNGMGAPLIANYQLAFFYPPGWLTYLFAAIGGMDWMAWSQTLLIVLHLIWAGAGMVQFAKSLGLGILAQTVSGLAFSLSGYLVARSSFFSMVWAAAWLPWILYAATEIVKSEKIRFSFKLLIFVSFQLLAGHAQLTWYSLLLSGIWIVFFSWSCHGSKRSLLTGLLYLGTVLGAAVLASIQLIPTGEFLLQSQRSAAVDYELGMTYSFWPWRLLTLFSPDFFGNPGAGTYFGYASYWEDAAYIGLIPLLLALSTLDGLMPKRKMVDAIQRRMVVFFWLVALVGFIFALGKNTPIFPFLYGYVPTFGMFNAPARWMIWAVLALCVLAGIGAEAWTAPVGKALRRFKVFFVIALAVTFGAGLTWIILRDVRLTFIQAVAVLGVWGMIFCALTMKMPRGAHTKVRWLYIASGLIAADLVFSQWSLIPLVDASFYSPGAVQINPPVNERVYLSYSDEYTLKFSRFFRIADFNPLENWQDMWEVLLPDMNLQVKVPYINNFDPLLPGRYANLINYLDQISPEKRLPYLQLLNVGLIEDLNPSDATGIVLQPVNAAGRFQWATCQMNATGEGDAWQQFLGNIQNLDQGKVIIENSQSNTPCQARGNYNITEVQNDPQRSIVKIAVDQDGWLVMADTWYPGWVATVDGEPVTIYPADYLLRGIPIPKGNHEVEIVYRPTSFYTGVVLSLVGWAGVLIIIFIIKIRFSFLNRL